MAREVDEITGIIVDAAYKIHVGLGPGLLESVYEVVLERELLGRGFQVERQKAVSFEFDGMQFDDVLRLDLFVESIVVVELKSVEQLAPVHSKQVLTYLRLLKLPVGLFDQLRCADAERGFTSHRKQLFPFSLRGSATPREFSRRIRSGLIRFLALTRRRRAAERDREIAGAFGAIIAPSGSCSAR